MSEPTPLLEVIAVDPEDARAAVAGGADRLELVSSMEHSGFDPSLETFEAVRAAVDVPLRVMIRRRDGFSAGGVQGVAELVHTAERLRRAGADEFVLGWLDADGTVDVEAVRAVLDVLAGAKWTFHKAIDAAPHRAAVYDAVRKLPGLDTVLTSGGFKASGDGLEVLRAEAEREREVGGPRLLVGGGLTQEALPALRAVGLDAFHVGTAVRVNGGWDSPVDVEKVALWRKVLA
jgi:copper homeostasis protein